MKDIIFIVIFVFCFFCIKSQTNLIQNPSFEFVDTCPTNLGQIAVSLGWDTLINGGGISPDLFNVCHSNPLYCGVPINWQNIGYQYPKTGIGYAGLIVTRTPSSTTGIEYIQGSLMQKLTQGHTYCSKINISLSERSKYSCVALGIYFDDGQIQSLNGSIPSPPIIPQIVNTGQQLDDTSSWMSLEGSFIANGTEEYITIGNFYPSNMSGIVLSYPNTNFLYFDGSYYYIDDVSVIDISTPAYAGNDTILLVSDTVYLGRPSEIGLDEACIWFVDGVPIDTVAGIWVMPDSTTTYVLQQTLCGNVQYDTVTITIDTGTSMERVKNREIKVFPNPSNGEIWYNIADEGEANLNVYSIDGKIVHQEIVLNNFNNNRIKYIFDKGVYVVVIQVGDRIFREKVVVVRQ